MAAAIALSERGRGRTAPNPNVGCVIVKHGRVVGRGWTQPGGRPHAEAVALEQAGASALGATAYVTLEPCAHHGARGPACADLLVAARPARVVAAITDPDPRTAGQGFARLRAAGIAVTEGILVEPARRAMAGFLTRQTLGRPHVTLKLATSLDGKIALPSGESRWITGPEARAHAHLERARADAILVGRGTHDADTPRLDVRLPGLEDRAPARLLLSRSFAAQASAEHPALITEMLLGGGGGGYLVLSAPDQITALPRTDHVLVEGGAGVASSFLAADLVDRLLLYRAPILIGEGRAAIGDIGLGQLSEAHGRWALTDTRTFGIDPLEIYERRR
ncbi:bifunctional diaminohydroxyphosphoribosylaminopyrimidine deaminase/5-amino-6-(5-phosphoribosylamino)uracil reductase RibD [Sphingomonas abietis]|uniref:Riboflavin biosynthesis protein RibD n=1 Tax=Sphingomonas abietis TaxID=3012344 RepID=A0ABY7NTK5_9SPHN|nr:bifunctional diaminohydroxyphosphoribosylaminopyrimidine deaminase/5-amino-6-(5-phosphoribosylamino)uracil reductase RibD [Sphingomonas abietis]WBO24723.1 bifunctional diaminohydroxyphosphoribosylaminopyrimidine deaminase/5-amino-6-(5-phosphoribosylamino)uracil reductase RibD [Sphingomonas abietis]